MLLEASSNKHTLTIIFCHFSVSIFVSDVSIKQVFLLLEFWLSVRFSDSGIVGKEDISKQREWYHDQ